MNRRLSWILSSSTRRCAGAKHRRTRRHGDATGTSHSGNTLRVANGSRSVTKKGAIKRNCRSKTAHRTDVDALNTWIEPADSDQREQELRTLCRDFSDVLDALIKDSADVGETIGRRTLPCPAAGSSIVLRKDLTHGRGIRYEAVLSKLARQWRTNSNSAQPRK
jgi:hypothetical protein